MEVEQEKDGGEWIDDDLVSFFDLLAQFDFEDQKRSRSVSANDSSVATPSEESLG